MKKLTLIFSFALAMMVAGFAQDDIVVGFTFPATVLTADLGPPVNAQTPLATMGGTSSIELKNGFDTKAAQASGWDLGIQTKAWFIAFTTLGYTDLTVSSRQQSGGNDPGPKNFEIQYSINNGFSWVPLVGGEIVVANDWETSFVDNLALPAECNNQPLVMIRWLMTTNISSGGGAVQANGKSKIDEIYVRGNKVNGMNGVQHIPVNFGPNPADDFINVSCDRPMGNISLFDLSGKILFDRKIRQKSYRIDTQAMPEGSYLLKVSGTEDQTLLTTKIAVVR